MSGFENNRLRGVAGSYLTELMLQRLLGRNNR